MKLGTLRNGRPDGQLVVVSGDLARCVSAGRIAPSLQAALDDWDRAEPALEDLARALENGRIAAQPFDPGTAMAPLPRAYQRIDAMAYASHLERLGAGPSAPGGASQWPMLHQAASDQLAGPTSPLMIPDGDQSADFGAEIVAVLGRVPIRPSREEAAASVRLLMLANEVTLRRWLAVDPGAHASLRAKPGTAFAPVAVTPGELKAGWRNERVHLAVRVLLDDMLFGQPDAGKMKFDFAELVAAAAQTRELGSGTLIGSGIVSNAHNETPPIRREGLGFACLAEARAAEKAKYGRARSPFLKPGNRVRIVAIDAEERPMFGTIDQAVVLDRTFAG